MAPYPGEIETVVEYESTPPPVSMYERRVDKTTPLMTSLMPDRIENICIAKGMRMTDQRRVIARVLSQSTDHPDVEELYRRAVAIDPHISIATVYRTVRLFEEAGILERHDFRDGRSRYEEVPESHHDHLIDLTTGKVIEFHSEDIEKLQSLIAENFGFRLVDHRLELYGVPLDHDGAVPLPIKGTAGKGEPH